MITEVLHFVNFEEFYHLYFNNYLYLIIKIKYKANMFPKLFVLFFYLNAKYIINILKRIDYI